MNILIVSQYFWPENFRINDFAVGLSERGHSVTVLTGIPNYPAGRFFEGYGIFKKKRQDYNGVKIVRVPIIARGTKQGFKLALNYFSYALSGCLLGSVLCPDDYDIIFVSQYSPVTIALPGIRLKKKKHIPLVLWIQDLWPETLSALGVTRSKKILGMVDKLVNYIYRNSDNIWVQSQGFRPFLEGKGVDTSKMRYFPNWAEGLYKPLEGGEDLIFRTSLPNGFRVMFAGNIGLAQDFETILGAAQLLKDLSDIQWIILGDGSLLNWVNEQVKQRKLESCFHLLGRHSMNEMPAYFNQADVMLVTLKKDPIFSLTIPGKIQSYMACGRPIIAALQGEGARVVSDSGAGLTCSPEDSKALAECVLRIYKMSVQDQQAMGLNARQYFENYFEREKLIDLAEVWMTELVN